MTANPFDEAVINEMFEFEYRTANGMQTLRARFKGKDSDYEPSHDFAADPPRYEFEDPTRNDRDFAYYPEAYGPSGRLTGVYYGEASPDERSLGEVERVVILDDE